MKLAITLLAFAAIIGIAVLALLADAIATKVSKRRERKAMQVRDTNLRKWGFVTYERTAKERRL